MCLLSGMGNDAQSTSNTSSMLLPSSISHYQYFLRTTEPSTPFTSSRSRTGTPRPSLHPYAFAHMHTFAQSTTVPKLTLAFAVVPFGGGQVLRDVHVWLYTVFTFVGPLLNAFNSPANMTPDLGTYVHTETVSACGHALRTRRGRCESRGGHGRLASGCKILSSWIRIG